MEKTRKGHLSLEDRQTLYVMSSEHKSDSEIGRQIGRHRSVVLRERRRNAITSYAGSRMTPLEKAKAAHEKARARQRTKVTSRGTVLNRRKDVRQTVLALLEQTKYSPEDVAEIISLSDLGAKLSGKTIRRWVKKERPAFQKYFPHRGKRRVSHLTPSRRKAKTQLGAVPKRSIHERPPSINDREHAGNFELDMVVCRQSTTSILSVRDRKTRRSWLELVGDLKAVTVKQAIIRIVRDIPPALRHSCTYDRGTEFADVHQLETPFGLVNYFCDAYCAWQKGSVENQNKEIRYFFPKGTDLSQVTNEQLKRIEALLNAKPRDCLEGFSAADAWIIEARRAHHWLH